MSAFRIELQAGGVAEVRQALRSVEDEVVRFQRAVTQRSQAGAKERESVAKAETKTQGSEWAKAAKEAAAFEKQKVKAAEQAEREKTRAAATGARDAAKLEADKARTAAKAAADGARFVEKAERDKVRATELANRERERDNDKLLREIERSEKEHTRIVERESQQRARAEHASRQSFRRDAVGRVGRTFGGAVGAAGSMAMGALTFGGGLAATDAIRDRMAQQNAAVGLSNAAFQPEVRDATGKVIQEEHKRPDLAAIQGHTRAVEASTGIKSAELSAGWQKYVEISSDYEGGKTNLEGLAKLAKATSSDFGDVMGSAGMLRAQNPNMTPEQMMTTMRGIIGQGQFGDISMRDMAKHASTVTAGASAYGGDQTKNQQRLLGLMQVAGRAADPAEAATAVARFGDDVLKHRGKLKAAGVDVADKDGKLSDPAVILRDMFKVSHGDLGKLAEMGLGERSKKVAMGLSGVYAAAEASKKGSGADAVYKDVSKLENAGYGQKDVDDSFQAVMATSSEKFEQAVTKLKEVLADKLMPKVEQLANHMDEWIPIVTNLINTFADLAGWVAQNPFAAAVGLMTGMILKDVAAAQISSSIQKIIAGGGGPGLGGNLGGMGKAGAALGIFGAAAGLTYAGIQEIDATLDAESTHDKTSGAQDANAISLAGAVKRGQGGAGGVNAAQAMLTDLQAKERALQKGPGFTETALGVTAGLFDGGEAQKQNENARQNDMRSTEQAIRALTDALKVAAAGGIANPNDPSRNTPMAGRGGSSS